MVDNETRIVRTVRRTSEQIEADRAEISRLYMQSLTHQEIADRMTALRNEPYSLRMIGEDVRKMREDWATAQYENYNTYINRELERLDVLEGELWKALRDSSVGRIRDTVTKYVNHEGEITGEQVVQMIEKSGVTPTFFSQIIEVQKERRKLLGLYADKAITVKHEHRVKGYKSVSPGDWPDNETSVIEGQIIN